MENILKTDFDQFLMKYCLYSHGHC